MSGSNDALPPHLEILVPFEWGVWRWFVLRGAGFPAELINRLKEPSCAARADALISAKDPVQWLFQNAIRSLNGMMDELRRKGEDRYGTSFKKILDGRRRLAEGKVPGSEDFSPEILRMFNQITEAMQECERLNTEWFVSFKVGAGAGRFGSCRGIVRVRRAGTSHRIRGHGRCADHHEPKHLVLQCRRPP